MNSLLDFLVSIINPVAIILFAIVLTMINSFIFKRMTSPSSSNDIVKKTISILIGFTCTIAFILALPIDKALKGQVLSFLGIIVSAGIALSSTTVLGNLIAGIMNNAMNRFKIGDLIKVNDLQGRVTRKGIFHTEVQLEDSNFITIPNLYIATNPVKLTRKTNTVVSTSVTLGYDISRIKVEDLLKQAAIETGLTDPYVYITSLGDFSVSYKIHGFLNDSGKYFMTSSKLNGQVMDFLHGNNIEIASPSIMNQRKVDDYVFIPRKEIIKKTEEEESNPELLVFDEAIESAKAEEKKQLIEKMEVKKKELQDRLKDAQDEGLKKRLEASVIHIDNLISKLSLDIEKENK
jgi:small-conductance mechanosensitive channel